MEGVILTPLKIIDNLKGNILHCMKKSDIGFEGFGEAYLTMIKSGEIKGWNKHSVMIVNLIVNIGEVEIVIFDDRKESKTYKSFYSVILSINNYKRLTIEPGLWFAFRGLSLNDNVVINIASIEHDPKEHLKVNLDSIDYNWSKI